MTKKSLYRCVQAFAIFAILGFASCRSDDGEKNSDNDSEIIQTLMSYKWTGQYMDYGEYSYGVSLWTQDLTFYFTSEDEGILYVRTVDRDSSLGTSRDVEHTNFTYYVSGNKVYISTGFVFEYFGTFMMDGDTMFSATALTSSDYTYIEDDKSGYHGTEGPITADMIFETSLHNTYDFSESVYSEYKGWYSYTIRYRVGVTTDAYKKGVSRMRVSVWASNAAYVSFNKSDIGKKYTETFYISSTDLTFINDAIMYSKDRSINLNYEVEYYNSKDNSWYTFKEGIVTFNM